MSGSTNTVVTAHHHRLRPRFTLRLLLVAITAVCIGLAIWTHRAREQRRAVERIKKSWGADVQYHFKRSQRSGYGIPIGQSPIPQFLLDRLGVDFFHRVEVVHVTDRLVLRELHKLPGLEILLVDCGGIRDAEIESLIDLRDLTSLSIFANERSSEFGHPPSTQLSDRSLAIVSRLPKLEDLYIDGRGFTADGIAELAQARRLRILSLMYCNAEVDASAAEPLKRTGRFESIEIQRWNHTLDKAETIVAWTRPPVAAAP